MDHQPTGAAPVAADGLAPVLARQPGPVPTPPSVPNGGVRPDGAVRVAPEPALRPVPTGQELLRAVLTSIHAHLAAPTTTTCPPRTSAGPDKEL
ncbi:hypothetical protein [Streptomyces sp. TS71-3]|uniref:hypothetical protein n=1 Tax=Streptomyces sp. TS71-3 TaxID=2733862 RepID=UPI001B25BEA2|nr:hypothetical protein [Streptomyces sp. TS71-3]GHJ40935.1 hypothetical protein Sm713_65440 [Streptomyces sp. TS71-3]